MIMTSGDRILIAHRRLFEKDQPRFFTGIVEHYENGIARVFGYSWIRDQLAGKIYKAADQRTKVISISSGTLLVYVLPSTLDAQALSIEQHANGDVTVTDGKDFTMDMTERCHT